jgi:hypothetical protein
MTYTKGIRKIFTPQLGGMHRADAENYAYRCGFRLLNFNGDIYTYAKETKIWIKTDLTIEDFEV